MKQGNNNGMRRGAAELNTADIRSRASRMEGKWKPIRTGNGTKTEHLAN